MSEEEKKAIEDLKGINITYFVNGHECANFYLDEADKVSKEIELILNLIEKQQKELNNIKEIEKSHKEENGKLRVELEQEKEKNKEYKKQLDLDYVDKNYISKDKIKEKIEDYEKMIEGTFKDNTWYGQNRRDNCYEIIRNLNELLEDK